MTAVAWGGGIADGGTGPDLSCSLDSGRKSLLGRLQRAAGRLHPEGGKRKEDARHDRPESDDRENGDRPCAWTRNHGHAEEDGDQTAQDHPPLSLDLLSQAHREDDAEHADGDGPKPDVEEQKHRGDPRRLERDHTEGDADQALEQQHPPILVVLSPAERVEHVRNTIHEREGGEAEHEARERHSRVGERHDPEEDRQDAPEQQNPPVARHQCSQHVELLSVERRCVCEYPLRDSRFSATVGDPQRNVRPTAR